MLPANTSLPTSMCPAIIHHLVIRVPIFQCNALRGAPTRLWPFCTAKEQSTISFCLNLQVSTTVSNAKTARAPLVPPKTVRDEGGGQGPREQPQI